MNSGYLLQVVLVICLWESGSCRHSIPKEWLEQLFPASNYPNTPRRIIGNSSCLISSYLIYYCISGAECYEVPKNVSTTDKYILVYDTVIQSIKKNAFSTWTEALELRITFNVGLKEIEPGAFLGLSKVEKLTIKENHNLTYFPPDLFQGLTSLKELYLLRNNIVSAKSISPAFAPSILPNLRTLDLSGNSMPVIGDNDFLSMINTTVTNLSLTMVKSYEIGSKAFLPFKNLVNLDLGGNHLNSSVTSLLVKQLASAGIDISTLGLRGNMLLDNTTILFKTISSTNISFLDLSDNQFGRIGPGFFPVMPNIQFLNLSGANVDELPKGTIDNNLMPNLKTLILARNLFSGVTRTMMIPTLKKLDLAANAGSLINTAFNIPPWIFSNMTNLDELILSKNDIESLKNGTLNYMKNLKYLGMSGAYLHSLYNYSFDDNTNLIYLDLSNNDFGGPSDMKKNFFAGLTNLLALDLSNCAIHRLASDAFSHLKMLKYLSLRGNALTSIPPNVFKNNPNLTIIDLSSNSLSSWNQQIFNNLNLSKVFLYNNQISAITPAMVRDFANVDSVDIYNNQIDCSCDLLKNIKTVYSETNFKSFSLFAAKSVCFSPAVGGKISIEQYWNSVRNTNLCYVMSIQTKLAISAGVIFFLLITAVIIYHYLKWEIIYWSYRLRQHFDWNICKRYKDRTLDEEEYKFDAFISYCHEDKKFVTKMVAILEGQFGFRLCLYERDFRVGDLISESVLESVAASRMTVMVLTNAFAKSQWCLWELHIAQQRLFFRTSTPDSLILIKLSDIDETIMSHTLRHLLKARIYLEWHKDYSKQKVFWQQLKSAIERNK